MKTYTQAEAKAMDEELDIVHQCLTDLFEFKYDSEKERGDRIREALKEIESITK